MVLAVDIGNSSVAVGVYGGGLLRFVFRISSERNRTADEVSALVKSMFDLHGERISSVEGTVISSVVPILTGTVSSAIQHLTGVDPIIVGPGIKTGVRILIENPAQLGGDLLAECVAALSRYKAPLAVIDMGTATVFTVIDRNSAIIGGAIAPGVKISMEALCKNTSLLQEISLEQPKKVIAGNTQECMKSGLIYGNAGMLDGMLERFERELGGELFAVATGGFAEKICSYTKRRIVYDGNLLLDGLYIIYQKNLQAEV
ncbi:MAG: type III pantothenate kinase [Clostridiales bacterium]|jgi:type III pantothenate kinase|nr:type III pantothenate kinase [Clostridiales bacterium]